MYEKNWNLFDYVYSWVGMSPTSEENRETNQNECQNKWTKQLISKTHFIINRIFINCALDWLNLFTVFDCHWTLSGNCIQWFICVLIFVCWSFFFLFSGFDIFDKLPWAIIWNRKRGTGRDSKSTHLFARSSKYSQVATKHKKKNEKKKIIIIK